jgi:hypothetical protein
MKTFLEWMTKINENSEVKEEMKEYLKNKFKGLEDVNSADFNFSMEAAIYWFTSDYHSGQWSDFYSILSTSDYRPGRMTNNIEGEPEDVQMLYQALEEKYK